MWSEKQYPKRDVIPKGDSDQRRGRGPGVHNTQRIPEGRSPIPKDLTLYVRGLRATENQG